MAEILQEQKNEGLPVKNPYLDVNDRRVFFAESPNEEFVWHRDDEDRYIKILEGEGWQLQFENTLPYLLKPGQSFHIKKHEYHRLIKGVDNLKVQIFKL